MAAPAARVLQVATAYRYTIRLFALSWLLGFGGQIMLRPLFLGFRHGFGMTAGMLLALLSLCSLTASLFMLIQVYRLAEGIGADVPLLWVLGMFFLPCLNLLVLLALSSKATAWLQAQGVPTGFLGPDDRVIRQLRDDCGIGCRKI